MEFNPKVKDFLNKNSEMTVIGLYWAGLWRMYVLILGISVAIGMLGILFE